MRLVRFFVVLMLLSLMNVAMAQNTDVRVKHKVQKSETIFGIAKKYGVTIEELIAVNPEMKKQGYELKKDDTINIPYGKNSTGKQDGQQTATQPTVTVQSGAQPVTAEVAGKKSVKVGVMLPLHDKDGDGRRMVEYYRGLLLGCDLVKK